MDFVKAEMEREFTAIGFKNQRRNLRTLPQTQKANVDKQIDSSRKALAPGKRVSRSGKVYWETRANRSDKKGTNL